MTRPSTRPSTHPMTHTPNTGHAANGRDALPRLGGLLLGVALLGGGLSACAPLLVGGAVASVFVAADRRTSGAQLEDQGIELRGAALLREQLGERGRVSITSYNRQVLLVGEVGSDADKALAASLVGSIENVNSVVNEIEVMGQASLSQRTTDAVVTSRLKARLLDARDLQSNAFKVTTNRGVVFLMGRVTPREAERATDIARTTTGVLRVVRAFETISEEELARLLPKPGPQSQPAPNSETRPQ